jgi:hypothetical protein
MIAGNSFLEVRGILFLGLSINYDLVKKFKFESQASKDKLVYVVYGQTPVGRGC